MVHRHVWIIHARTHARTHAHTHTFHIYNRTQARTIYIYTFLYIPHEQTQQTVTYMYKIRTHGNYTKKYNVRTQKRVPGEQRGDWSWSMRCTASGCVGRGPREKANGGGQAGIERGERREGSAISRERENERESARARRERDEREERDEIEMLESDEIEMLLTETGGDRR